MYRVLMTIFFDDKYCAMKNRLQWLFCKMQNKVYQMTVLNLHLQVIFKASLCIHLLSFANIPRDDKHAGF